MTSWSDSDEFAQMCAVQLASVEGTFLGSGFFVAQRVVATCAHVVEKVDDELVIGWNGQALRARVLVREPALRRGPGAYPYPDLAFVGVETLDNPTPYLEQTSLGRGERTLRIFGFSRYTPERSVFRPEQDAEPDISDVQVVGHSGAYVKVDARHIVPGLSGAPAVDAAGLVRGMVKSGALSKGESGFVLPSGTVASFFRKHQRLLTTHMRSRPPLTRPRAGSPLHRMLRAQREVAKHYPYRLAQLTRRAAPPLSTIYVEQRTEARGPGAKPVIGAAPAPPDVISPIQMLRRHRNALVLGGPGGGKSTLLQQLVAECAAWWLRPEEAMVDAGDGEPAMGRVVAIRATATDLLGQRAWFESVALAVNNELGGYQDLGVPPEMFQAPPVAGAEWLILVDGLDEVIDTTKRRRLVDMLALRVAEFGAAARFVVTSRRLAESELIRLRSSLMGPDQVDRLGEYVLRPFDSDAVEQFATNWFRPALGERSPISPRDFLDTIHTSGLAPLVRVPLLATIAAVVYEEQPTTDMPMDRAGLYDVFVTVLLTHRNQRLGSRQLLQEQLAPHGPAAQEYGDFLFDSRLECLSHVALGYMRGNRRSLLALASAWIRAQERKRPLGVTDEHLRELLLSTGLVVSQGEDLGFVHQSFAEYLAARHGVPGFDADEWPRSVLARGPDSLGMFTFAGWARAGNDPVPVYKALLDPGRRREFPGIREAATVIEDGGGLSGGPAKEEVMALAAHAVREIRGIADRTVPALNQLLRAIQQRVPGSGVLTGLAGDARLSVTKRTEAAKVLVTNGSDVERQTGLATLTRLAYETRMSDEDRLWVQRTLAEVGGEERPHAIQRLVQTVETTEQEAARARALALLTQLDEARGAALALFRRGIDPRRPLTARLQALDAMGIVLSEFYDAEPGTQRPVDYRPGRLGFVSLAWSQPPAIPVTEQRQHVEDRIGYGGQVALSVDYAVNLDPASAETLVDAVMRDRMLGWPQRMAIVTGLHAHSPALALRAAITLAEDRRESPSNRTLSIRLLADRGEVPAALAHLNGWLADPRQPLALRREALVQLAALEPAEFLRATVARADLPIALRANAAALYGRTGDLDGARYLLSTLAAEPSRGLRARAAVWSARVSLLTEAAARWRRSTGRAGQKGKLRHRSPTSAHQTEPGGTQSAAP
jgi:hypothetical protein